MTSAPAIGFDYQISHWPARLGIGISVLAMCAIAVCSLALLLKLVLATGVMGLFVNMRRRAPQWCVKAIALGHEGDWTVRQPNHVIVPAVLTSFRVLGPFVLLRLAVADARAQTVLLAPDNSDADMRRRLRMRLAATQPVKVLADL